MADETTAISLASFATPTNIAIFLLFGYVVFVRTRSTPLPEIPESKPRVFATFTPRTLRPYNGSDNKLVYLAVEGKVFDVTAGSNFYGPGGPYENFAGRDASRGLAKNSFDEEMLTPINQPIDKLEDLTDDERRSLSDWKGHFEGKYLLVGKLVEEGSEEAKEAGI